ncbi:hypothetical protein EJD97_019390 [Solanum chilense]|uniref:Uncharacterized protein n=1 Tax=Solanum chilense TaxID=4083 RepID=A0A6N2B2E6_SOLCI|nr:hypothetical protein EJD97_019390 [Solanum chilense]
MSDPSSASKQMLTTLSEIEPIAFYSPCSTWSKSNPPTSSPLDNPENPFHSIDLQISSVPTKPGPHHEMLSDALFERILPRNKTSESNILAASEELVTESLAMMREEVRVEESEPFQNEEIRETQPIFDRTLDFGRYKVERRDVSASKKGKDKVVGEVFKRRPITRSDAKRMMVDALKDSAKSTTENMSARTFKVSNFKLLESGVIDVSAEETEKGYRKKRSVKTKRKGTKKAEQTKSTNETGKGKRKRSQGPGTQEDGSVNNRVNDIAVHLDETLLGKILRVPRDCTRKGNPMSKMAQLIEDQDQLKHEVEELTMRLSGKDAELAILKAELLTAQTEGPGTNEVQALERENLELRAKVMALQEKAIKDNDAANARLTLIIQSLSHQPPPS